MNEYEEHNPYTQIGWGDKSKFCFGHDPKFVGGSTAIELEEGSFVEVVLPRAVPGVFTYRVPADWVGRIEPGQRVVVPFARGNWVTGIVWRLLSVPPEGYAVKFIEFVVEEAPLLTPTSLVFWEWVSRYYMAHLGEVMLLALPSVWQLEAQTRLLPSFDWEQRHQEVDWHAEAEEVLKMWELIRSQEGFVLEKSGLDMAVDSHKYAARLISLGVVIPEKELKERYRPLRAPYLSLSPELQGDDGLKSVLDQLSRWPKQEAVVLEVLHHLSSNASDRLGKVPQRLVMKRLAGHESSLATLLRNGILIREQVEVDRFGDARGGQPLPELTSAQRDAFSAVEIGFDSKLPVMLLGASGSGKTVLYLHAIQRQLELGLSVLVLVPETALSAQLVGRFQSVFGDRVVPYHNRLSAHERAEVWARASDKAQPSVVVGTRASIWLPFHNIGLIVVDEEHDVSYKQSDGAPRIQARDAALYLGRLHNSNIILGSATPSAESYQNALLGRYHLVSLTERYGGLPFPRVEILDVASLRKSRQMHGLFSHPLMEAMDGTLARGHQVMLFQNRRGFSPHLQCEGCGWVPGCSRCDVSLTYYKQAHSLKCHYCGAHEAVPEFCPTCGSHRVVWVGSGTERVEEELQLLRPDWKIARMDLETTRSRVALQHLLDSFSEGAVQVLIGTQMMSKGLDFANVGLVGVLHADALFRFPDFRAPERALQLLLQLAGRAGRGNHAGSMLVQTYDPSHPVVQQLVQVHYASFLSQLLTERQQYRYPPYVRLIRLVVKHRDPNLVEAGAAALAAEIRSRIGQGVMGPVWALVPRVNNWFHQEILMKLEAGPGLGAAKDKLRESIKAFHARSDWKAIRLVLDVDP